MSLGVDVRLDRPGDAREVAAAAARWEAAGYATIWSRESANDPFLSLAIAASATRRIGLGTSIAVAFARNPMSVAYLGSDLARYSDGRFTLGLGTQIKAHVERRFGMPWSRPAARMEEFVRAVREIWRCWRTGDRLDFRGEFYTHTLMLPDSTPDHAARPDPLIMLAAVGDRMLDVAARVGDGLLAHAFSSREHLRRHTVPAIERGLAAAGRDRADFVVSAPVLMATGATGRELSAATRAMRRQIAFYASTAAYRTVLETHGWDDLAAELNRLSRTPDPNRWDTMADLVDDKVLGTFAVVAEPDRVADLVVGRMGDLVNRVSLYTAVPTDDELLADIARRISTTPIRPGSPASTATNQETA
ncbi:TIGR03617 family F420-dependent LLM class oxidoreductase [Dactylosporangium sp. CA-092794]|uniref:TIGR03617 family F420-dependent LLM class oxidoreductase n=1 Tax=Dactylosporangium sp. CA-092794 TaxID=3239929 RepID=UPI003D8FA621